MLEEYKNGNQSAEPNIISYCSLIDAYVKSTDIGSLERAEEIYRDIYKDYSKGDGGIKPYTILANQIMDAWSKSGKVGAAEKAEAILQCLCQIYKETDDDEVKPNGRSFTSVINSYAKSRKFHKAAKAKNILDYQIAFYTKGNVEAKPNVFSFTAVMNACAFTKGDDLEAKEALGIATATYKLMGTNGYDAANHVTYAMFLRACINLIPNGPSKVSAATSVFRKCRESGQVTEMILLILERSFSSSEVHAILGVDLGTDKVTFAGIPDAWKFIEPSQNKARRRNHRNNRG